MWIRVYWAQMIPSVTTRRPRTWSGEISVPKARSSSSVTEGHLSGWLRLDFSFLSIPPPVFLSRLLLSIALSASFRAFPAACDGLFRDPFISPTEAMKELRERAVLLCFRDFTNWRRNFKMAQGVREMENRGWDWLEAIEAAMVTERGVIV